MKKNEGVKKLLNRYEGTVVQKTQLQLEGRSGVTQRTFNMKEKFAIIKELKGMILDLNQYFLNYK